MKFCKKPLVMLLFAVLAVLAAPETASAYKRVLLSDYPALTAYIDQLRAWAEQHDAAAIRDQLAQDFITERDFGGMHLPGYPAWWNFSSIYPFASRPIDPDEPWWRAVEASIRQDPFVKEPEAYIDSWKPEAGVGASRFTPEAVENSWGEFMGDLPHHYVELQGEGQGYQRFCGEAGPLRPVDWTPEDGPSMKGSQAYVDVKLLNIRKAPTLDSPVVGQQDENNIVEIVSDRPMPDPRHSYRWLKVQSPWEDEDFKPGFVPARYLLFTSNRRICFRRNGPDGPWRIVAVEKAGD